MTTHLDFTSLHNQQGSPVAEHDDEPLTKDETAEPVDDVIRRMDELEEARESGSTVFERVTGGSRPLATQS